MDPIRSTLESKMKNDFLHYIDVKNTFSVLTFNTWLLKTPLGISIAIDIESRIDLIPDEISQTGVEIVALQEVWNPTHRLRFKKRFSELGYTFCAENFDPSPRAHPLGPIRTMFGNGLMIFLKFPLREKTKRITYSHRTRPDETFVDKGAILTQVFIPSLAKWINIFNSHLGAITFDAKTQSYDSAHLKLHNCQVDELLQFVSSETNEPSIIAMDFGVHYYEYKNGQHSEKFCEAYSKLKGFRSSGELLDTAVHVNKNFDKPDYTFHKENPYVSSGHFGHCPDEVLDYIFVTKNSSITPINSKVMFQKPVMNSEAKKFHLSDHFGVMTTFASN